MSINPRNDNYPQAVLYQAGVKAKGRDFANVESDNKVREAGLRRIAKRAGAFALSGLLAVGTVAFIENASSDRVGFTSKEVKQLIEEQNGQSVLVSAEDGRSTGYEILKDTSRSDGSPMSPADAAMVIDFIQAQALEENGMLADRQAVVLPEGFEYNADER